MFGEDAVERQHNITNKYNRVFANISNFYERQKSIQRAQLVSSMPVVLDIRERAVANGRRNFSPEVVNKKRVQAQNAAEEKSIKKQNVSDLVRTLFS